MTLGQVSAISVLAACLSATLVSQAPKEVHLDAIEKLELGNLKADLVSYLGRAAVRIVNTAAQGSGYGEGLAPVRGLSLKNGTIDVTLTGDTAPDAPRQLRGFVGIAFRVKDPSHFECFYIRPKNGRSEDQLQRNHSAQYMSIPEFPWDKLRSESPSKYESYVDLVPGQWTEFKIQVSGTTAKLYVNGAEQPTLIVNDLKKPALNGGVALWVGQGTIAHFADLKITP